MLFDPQLLARIGAIIEQRTGMAQGAQSPANLEAAVRELSGDDPEGFLHTLAYSSEVASPWQLLLNALFIGETYFLRNRAHFTLLRQNILPEIVARRQAAGSPQINIWSAGCASGEETYSLAITLHETLPDLPRWTIRLFGTDINGYALGTAEQAIYRNWSFRHTDTVFQNQYFLPLENGWQLRPFIREMVTFRQRNVLIGPPIPQVDLIFCCNVLLYFEETSVRRAEAMLYEALSPGGWLILGQAEALRFDRERWVTHLFPGAVAYQKPLRPVRGAQPAVHHRSSPTAALSNPEKDRVPDSLEDEQMPMNYEAAVRAMRVKQYDDAERILADILRHDPKYVPAWVLMGCVLGNRRALPEAQRQLDEALRLDALRADAHYLKGVLYMESQQADAATAAFRSALYCQRGHPLAAMLLGHLYLKAGKTARARRVWQEAVEVLEKIAPEQIVSDLSDWTAEGISEFLSDQIKLLEN
ncbi:MAG: tetratricopeptide repeat protein [Anaerolineae bacterium]|nr:tetratricopeptide repeat protein [Anaerolineae bacterium]